MNLEKISPLFDPLWGNKQSFKPRKPNLIPLGNSPVRPPMPPKPPTKPLKIPTKSPVLPPEPKQKYRKLYDKAEYRVLNVPVYTHDNKPYSINLNVNSDLIKNCVDAYQNNNNIKIIDKIISNGQQGVVKYGCKNNTEKCDEYIIKISFEKSINIENINRYGEIYINNLLNSFRNSGKVINSPKLLGYFACPIYDDKSIITTINSMVEKGIEYDYNDHTHILYQVYETVHEKYTPIEKLNIILNCTYNIFDIIEHNIFLINNGIFNLDMHIGNMIIDKNNQIKFIDYGYSYSIASYLYMLYNIESLQNIDDNILNFLINKNICLMDLKLSLIYYSFAVILISNKLCFNSSNENKKEEIYNLIFDKCIIKILTFANNEYDSKKYKNELDKKFKTQIMYKNLFIEYINNYWILFDLVYLNANNDHSSSIIELYENLHKIFGMKIKEYIENKNNNLKNLNYLKQTIEERYKQKNSSYIKQTIEEIYKSKKSDDYDDDEY